MTQNPVIPLCQSEFLEDLSIEFGRRFVPRHPWYGFEAEVDQPEYEGVPLEKLTFRASTFYDTQVILELWEDRSLRISVILHATPNNGEFRVGFYRQVRMACTSHPHRRVERPDTAGAGGRISGLPPRMERRFALP